MGILSDKMKPTFKLALLQNPGHGARRWLQHLTQHEEYDSWRASFETETNLYDITVGMPAVSHPHAVLVILDVKDGVTELVTRSLWHAKRRGILHWFALLHYHEHDQDLFDVASLELREAFQSVGLDGNSLTIFTSGADLAGALSSMYSAFDALDYQHLEPFAQPEAQYPLTRLIRRLFFSDTDVSDCWRGASWSYFCRGEDPASPADKLWRFHSILYQACCGYFDDLPDLLVVAEGPTLRRDEPYAQLAFALLGQVGTWELWPLVEAFLARRGRSFYNPGTLWFSALRHWNYLSCVPLLLSAVQSARTSEQRESITDKVGEILGAKPWEDMERLYQNAQASYAAEQLLFLGKPFSSIEVAKHLLPKNRAAGFERNLTNLFMAQTGQPYNDRELYIFLQNRAASFQPNRRYFNGHELPDYATRDK